MRIFYIVLIFGVTIFGLDNPCFLQGASLVHPPERPFRTIWLKIDQPKGDFLEGNTHTRDWFQTSVWN